MEKLERLCCHEREIFRHPFGLVTDDGRNFMAACDGSMMVAIETEVIRDACTSESAKKALVGFIEGKQPDSAISPTTEDVGAWAGDAAWEFDCSYCKGSGKIPASIACPECKGDGEVDCYCMECNDAHHRDCARCDGTGDGPASETDVVGCDECGGTGNRSKLTSDTIVYGQIVGTTIDRRRVARLMSVVSGPCRVWPSDDRVNFRGGDWHATLMKVRHDADEMPVFERGCHDVMASMRRV